MEGTKHVTDLFVFSESNLVWDTFGYRIDAGRTGHDTVDVNGLDKE
jgi:hypothetical protein